MQVAVGLGPASAQQPPPVRIRGTIEVVDGPVLTINTREGDDVKVRMTDNVAVFGVATTPLSEISHEAPVWLVEIVERLLAKDPADRFQSASELSELLARHLARVQDPSLPPVEHPWAKRRPGASRRVRRLL